MCDVRQWSAFALTAGTIADMLGRTPVRYAAVRGVMNPARPRYFPTDAGRTSIDTFSVDYCDNMSRLEMKG
jgi:hypothetical protein